MTEFLTAIESLDNSVVSLTENSTSIFDVEIDEMNLNTSQESIKYAISIECEEGFQTIDAVCGNIH